MRLILIVESSAFLLPPYSEPRRNASRHRTPSPPIYLSEVTEQVLRLIASISPYPAEGKVSFS